MAKRRESHWGMDQGRLLRRIREAQGIHQVEPARAAGVGGAAYSLWESGAVEPSTLQLQRVAAFYEIQLADLLEALGYEPYRGHRLTDWWMTRSPFSTASSVTEDDSGSGVNQPSDGGSGQFRARKDHHHGLALGKYA